MRAPLPPAFLTAPLAHRAYHDVAAGRPENSRAAIRAAIAAGYGIEIDLQLSKDGVAMVFQSYALFPHLTVLENVRIALQRKLGTSFHFWKSERSVEVLNDEARLEVSAKGTEWLSKKA